MSDSAIDAPLYLTQNDGTIMRAETAARFPVFSFASGPDKQHARRRLPVRLG